MKLEKSTQKLTNNLDYKLLNGKLDDFCINKLCYDSRKVEENDLFICINGSKFDSHKNINEVIAKGAKVLVVEIGNAFLKDAVFNSDIIVLGVDDSRKALAIISSNYFGNPTNTLKVIGITGTKGKTTTAFMIKNILEEAGNKVGMIGTIGIFYDGNHILTHNTTPESYTLHEYFAKMLDSKVQYVVMEVSSQSLKYYRVYGIDFYYAVWTNIAPEHIGENEHSDFNDYKDSKLKILSMCKNAVVNGDTDYLDEIESICKKNGIHYVIRNETKPFKLKIPGGYNIDNANLAYTFAKDISIDEEVIKKALENTIVPGRCEVVYKGDFTVIVDFSYENNGAIKFLNTIKEENPKRIVTVFGCGGNRSKDRRYGMGEVTGKLADFVVLTADNSRYEKTIDIIKDIESTLSKYKKKDDLSNGYVIYEDRYEAIEYAIKNHKVGDVICVMGKGHEPTMEFNGKEIRFLDREVILEIINKLGID